MYPFTAPVYKLVMEDHLLHALTETGLESYTLRTGHQLCRKLEHTDDINIVSCWFLTMTAVVSKGDGAFIYIKKINQIIYFCVV